MQKDVHQVSDSWDSYVLTFSIQKTEVVYQPAIRKPIQRAYHHTERSKIASGIQVHLPWNNVVLLCTLMMKSMPGWPKLEEHLADYVEVFGVEVGSDLTQS